MAFQLHKSSSRRLQDGGLQWVGLYGEDIKALNFRSMAELILIQPKKETMLSAEVWNKRWSTEAEIQKAVLNGRSLREGDCQTSGVWKETKIKTLQA